MEITYSTTGFLKDAAYTADLLQLLRSYESKFPGLNSLHLEVKELPYYAIDGHRQEPFDFLADEKRLVIRLTQQKSYDRAGKATGLPSPFMVYSDIRFMLDKAVKQFCS